LISAEPTYFSDNDKLLLQADPHKQCAAPDRLNHSGNSGNEAKILHLQAQSPFADQFEWEQMVNARRNAQLNQDQNQKPDSEDTFFNGAVAGGGAGKVTWERVKFTLFSMLVSSSFFAAYDITTFYAGVVIVVGF